jgi:predicted DNA-binding protein
MNMLRHNHVAVDDEAILAAGFLQDFEEQVATEGGAEVRAAVVATAGDVVQIVVAVEAVETLRHGDEDKQKAESVDVMNGPVSV